MFWRKKENVYQALAVEGLKPGDHFFMIDYKKEVIECILDKFKYNVNHGGYFCSITEVYYKVPYTSIKGDKGFMNRNGTLDSFELYATLDDCLKKKPLPKTYLNVGKLLEEDGWEIEKRRKEGDLLWYYYWDGVSAMKESLQLRYIYFEVRDKGIIVKTRYSSSQKTYRTAQDCEKDNKVKVVRIKS